MNKQKWIDRASELGFDGLEITQSSNSSREVSCFAHEINSFVNSRIRSTSIRALSEGKIVAASLEKTDDATMEDILKSLKETAAMISDSEKDELVPVMETEEVHSNKSWKEPSASEIQNFVLSLERKLETCDPRVVPGTMVNFYTGKSESELVNSLGLNVSDNGQLQMVSAQLTMEQNGTKRDDALSELVFDIATFDQDAFVEKLKNQVAEQLGASSVSSRTCPVIFNHETMTTLFSCFAQMFSGTLIAKGISPLAGKLNEKIFSDKITVIDDPRNTEPVFLQNYDDEGHPTYAKDVVKDGVFETILHNTRSAIKMNAKSTGNGFKSGGGATDASPMNMYIVPGQDSFDQLLEKMGNGVVITDLAGMHAGVDFITTNFSLQAKGYLVENGKKVRALTLITVAGNFLDMMKNVEAVGSDLEWKAHTVAAPSILFKSAAIGGSDNADA